MKKQLVLIHGGNSFKAGEDFISRLLKKTVAADDFKWKPNWKGWLNNELGSEYEIFYPQMPNKESAKYEEWKTWFQKLVPFLKDGVILIGHSLGGVFLAKYLSENQLPVPIKGIFLVAPPFGAGDFSLSDLSLLDRQVENLFIYHSKDDPIVSFSNLDKYMSILPNAKSRIFENMGHFRQETFPELVEDIKRL